MNEQHERRKLIKEKYPDELSKYEGVIAERFVELAKTQIGDIKL